MRNLGQLPRLLHQIDEPVREASRRSSPATLLRAIVFAWGALALAGCGDTWNDPYPSSDHGERIFYTAFTERPKHLDPVQSYSEDEATFTQQIYEPPLQYHYLKRPYQLVPLTAVETPRPTYEDAQGRALPSDAAEVAFSVYEIRIRPGIRYQPHPAFARDASGGYRYLELKRADLEGKYSIADFPETGTRELLAEDFAYQIKRLAHPSLHSPILGLMVDHIAGLKEYVQTLKRQADKLAATNGKGAWLDLREFPLAGVEVVDKYTYRVRLEGRYEQFVYWLAMPFFAPVPWEADKFFSQPGMAEKNLTLDWWPVGTGPFMLVENNPNARMVLARNPNFRGEPYPSAGDPGDRERGLLADAGKPMPFLDRVVFTREKEAIPYWNKFLQGYYDVSGISSDTFDQAVRVSIEGDAAVSKEMEEKGVRLETAVAPTTIYFGFNWLDPVVGGASERARKLRQAISIAIDYEEYVSIFQNGRGLVAMGPLAPGIVGFRDGEAGINRVVYAWVEGQAKRKPIEVARALLAEAGYPDGRDAQTGEPLVLNLDARSRGPGDKAVFDWYRRQFAKLNLQLEVRDTDYNRFQDKVRKGAQQLFVWGWNADYPDPENFLFLLYGPQSRAKFQGENSANYANPQYDRLFERMRDMQDSPERDALIDRMVEIAREDAPWVWGWHPKEYSLIHAWMGNMKPNKMARNKMKYYQVDVDHRAAARDAWNRPDVRPVLATFAGLALLALPAVLGYRRRERAAAR
jgi:ABC-type transport system substrate-binding protein